MRGLPFHNFYMKTALISFFAIVAGPAGAVQPQTLAYQSNQRAFTLTLTENALSLASRDEHLSIPVNSCSKPLLDKFWTDSVTLFKTLRKGDARPTLKLNAEIRMVPAFGKTNTHIATLDRQVFHLMMKERKTCAKK